jgi:Protein of unknown function (DUF4233)
VSNKQLRQLCGTVLIMEAVVIGLAIPVAIVQEHLRHGVAGGVGGGLAVCALVLGGMVGRPGMGWVLWAGTVLQVLVIAAGAVVPAMYILGVIFAALWITGIWLARRLQARQLPAPPAPRASSSSEDTHRPSRNSRPVSVVDPGFVVDPGYGDAGSTMKPDPPR